MGSEYGNCYKHWAQGFTPEQIQAMKQALIGSNAKAKARWDDVSDDSIKKDDAVFLRACGIQPL